MEGTGRWCGWNKEMEEGSEYRIAWIKWVIYTSHETVSQRALLVTGFS